MNQIYEKTQSNPQQPTNTEVGQAVPAQIIDSTAGIEGKIAEVAQNGPSNNQAASSGDNTQAQSSAASKAALAEDREFLKQRLLKNAPAEEKMKVQVETILVAQKNDLEEKVRAYSRTQNYHQLSLLIMRLREVIRQLEELAQMSYEALKELWLRVVHQFA